MAPPRPFHLLGVLLLAVGTVHGGFQECSELIYRLPEAVKPVSYDVHLTPEFPVQPVEITDFKGEVVIKVTAVEDTDVIVLHKGNNIYIEKVTVVLGDLTPSIDSIDASPEYNSTTEKMCLGTDMKQGDVATLTFSYTAKLGENMAGFYKSTYSYEGEDGKAETGVMLATQFESTDAREAFPCFDEPSFKATFTIAIDVPEGFSAISNTDPVDKENTEGARTITFEETVIMPTYLVAFIVYDEDTYDFTHSLVSKSQVIMTTWGRRDAVDNHLADYSLQVTPKILKELEDYTEIEYKKDNMKKIDQAAIPDFSAGAMENWGLVTYRETGLFFSESESTEANRKSIAAVIAHELTHQWFGNLVTMHWWSETWLNEGFARFFQYYVLNPIYPSWRTMEQLVVDQQQSVFATDSLAGTKPLTNPDVETPSDISGQFSSAAYSKGGALVRQMSLILGEDKFREGLQHYLQNRSYDVATEDHLFSFLEDHMPDGLLDGTPDGTTLVDILKTWTNTAGYPVVTVKNNGQNLVLDQVRFLLEGTRGNEVYGVRLNVTFEDRTTGSYWLRDKSRTVGVAGKPLLVVNNTGYFRVNYDNNQWDKLTEILLTDRQRLAPLERATLVDDVLNLARAGDVGYDKAIALLSYLEVEVDYIPWVSGVSGLDFLYRMLGNDEVFTEYARRILGTVYADLGFHDEGGHLTKLHRTNVLKWACRMGLEDCRKTAGELLANYLDDGEPVPPNLRSSVYCYGAMESERLWNKLWMKFTKVDDVSERSVLFTALGCSSVKSTLYMYLEESLSGRYIRSQDASTVYAAVYANTEGVDVALEFLIDNFAAIRKVYVSMNSLNNVINGIANRLTTDTQKEKFQKFLNANSGVLGSLSETALSAVNSNLKWLEIHKDTVLDQMKAGDGTDSPTSSPNEEQ